MNTTYIYMKETWSNRCPNVRACTKIGGHERNKTWWKIKASFWCPFKMGHPQHLNIYICLPSAFLHWAFKLGELLLFLLPIGFFRRTLRLYLKDNPEGGFIVVGGRRHSGIRAEPDADGFLIWIICKWLQKKPHHNLSVPVKKIMSISWFLNISHEIDPSIPIWLCIDGLAHCINVLGGSSHLVSLFPRKAPFPSPWPPSRSLPCSAWPCALSENSPSF